MSLYPPSETMKCSITSRSAVCAINISQRLKEGQDNMSCKNSTCTSCSRTVTVLSWPVPAPALLSLRLGAGDISGLDELLDNVHFLGHGGVFEGPHLRLQVGQELPAPPALAMFTAWHLETSQPAVHV
jgi:hypothetical protein